MSTQKKRAFQIEAFKHRVVVDPKYAEKTWKVLEHAIHEIYNHNASGLSFEELYRNAYNMVLHKFGEKLYTGLVTTMTSHLKEISQSIESAQGEIFLDELNRKWADHNKALQMIRDILMYMDRTFVPSNHKTSVHELGLNLWRDVVIHSIKTQARLLDTLLELVLRERNGEVINRGLMRNIIKMLMDLGLPVYQLDFEKHFLDVSSNFYGCESQKFIETCDCGDYLKKAERRLNEELERVSHYLDPRSESKITNVVEKEMIESHMHTLVHMENSGLVSMLVDDKYEDLQRMYNLFRRVPAGLTIVKEVMTSFIRDTGKQLIMDPERLRDPVDFVQRLLDLKDKYDKVITMSFNNDKTFQNALNSSFEYFINLNARSPEFISLFVDDKLRRGLKGVGEEDVEIVLDKVMMLFRYLQEKDVFEKYYKQHLAKRLLSGKTISDDAERSLIVKLKTECGYQFTSKLEGMFTDMKTSHDTMQGFYTDYSLRSSNWKNGSGDVVAELSSAAKDAGVGFGIYLSPWDRHETSFGDTLRYNEFYLAQMTELLTRYGEITDVFLDGAKGEGEKDMNYLYTSWNSLIHQLQPGVSIFSDLGPETRWVGNEYGIAGFTCWSLFNKTGFEIGQIDLQYNSEGDPLGPDWIPATCDVSIRPGWFWHASESPMSARSLLEIYYKSVGRNCKLLLNVPPNSSGLISDEDIQVLQEFAELRRSIFSHNLAINAVINASSIRGGIQDTHFSPYNILKEGIYTYWAPEENQTKWILYINLEELVSFNVLQLQEPIHMGQRVIEFHLETLSQDGVWMRVVNGTTIGYQRLLLFPKLKSQYLKLVVDKSRADPLISYLGIYMDSVTVLRDTPDKKSGASFNGSQVLQTTTHNSSLSAAM